MIRARAPGAVEGLEFRGAEAATPGEGALEAISSASVILIGPSNPLASIAPILAVPGIREALAEARAPVVAVSPIVGGAVLKGPTEAFMAFAGLPATAAGVSEYYGEVLDGLVADEPVGGLPVLETDTRMGEEGSRARLARQSVAFAESLSRLPS